MSDLSILHLCADKGAENPYLSQHGEIVRFTINPEPNEHSQAVAADIRKMPLKPGVEFDLGIGHPPCGGVSPMSDTGSGSREDWPDLIPECRELFEEHCEHYIIENKPRDSLKDPVILNGHMFQLGIEYERAFETSFPVEQPPRQSKIADTSTFFYSEWSKAEWVTAKGTTFNFPKEHIAKNTIPADYLKHLLKSYYRYVDTEERPNYSNYDAEMDARRSREQNAALDEFKEVADD